MYTLSNSDLFWKVYKVHHKGTEYVKLKIMFFYKNSKNICWSLNPEGRPLNFKVIRNVYDSWDTASIK